jgi:hypothetical protein
LLLRKDMLVYISECEQQGWLVVSRSHWHGSYEA